MATPPGYILVKAEKPTEDKQESKQVDKKSIVALKQKPGSKILGYAIGTTPKNYTLLFRSISNQANTAGGVDYANFSWNISSSADFSSAAALFSECRVIASRVTLSPSLPSSGVVSRQLVGAQPGSTANPTTEADVLQLQPLKMFTTGRTTPLSLTYRIPGMQWALCSSPAPGPYAGLYGGFWFSSAGQVSMSTVVVLLEVLVEFRGRA